MVLSQNTSQSITKPPNRTQHKQKLLRKVLPQSSSKCTAEQWAAIEKEIECLPELIKANYLSWKDGAKPFQLECIAAQVRAQDVLLHAATGAGKTGIAAGPHLLPSSEGKITLMISPLLSLHEEQVGTFEDEFNLRAIAVNSANGGCNKEKLSDIVDGKWHIVILSPEMILSRQFIDGVLRKPEFGRRCLSVFIDEAHCVSHWGDSFRKKYGSLGILRAFLPKATPIIAVSATLTARVCDDLIAKLRFNKDTYLHINIGNDRPNVSQVVRAMEHPMNTYRDIDFLVPDNIKKTTDIKKSFLYSDDINLGGSLTDHLNARVPLEFRHLGLIRPYNATMSKNYRKQAMDLFKEGIIRVLVCTDAAGMGCNIPDVEIVVQWKAPINLSSWVQRAGRAARAPGCQGLAIMLVEKSAFEVDDIFRAVSTNSPNSGHPTSMLQGPRGGKAGRSLSGRGRGRGGRGSSQAKRKGSGYGILHGQKRGTHSGAHDAIERIEHPVIIMNDSIGEGLYQYIQTTFCRRLVLTTVFRNAMSNVPPLLCCDLCNPLLFDQTRPSKPIVIPRQKNTKKGLPNDAVCEALYEWRHLVKREFYPQALWAPHAILDNATCELLSSIGPIPTIEILAVQLKNTWARWDELGESLFKMVSHLNIQPVISTAKSQKRVAPSKEPTDSDLPTSITQAQLPQGPVPKRPRITYSQSSSSTSQLAATFPPSEYDSFFAGLRHY